MYEVLQAGPQSRRVALKLIRSEPMSEEMSRRFSIESSASGAQINLLALIAAHGLRRRDRPVLYGSHSE